MVHPLLAGRQSEVDVRALLQTQTALPPSGSVLPVFLGSVAVTHQEMGIGVPGLHQQQPLQTLAGFLDATQFQEVGGHFQDILDLFE